MKSYSVKSNAKRAARRLVALHTFVPLEAIEPVLDIDDQVTDGGAWFPAVRVPSDTPDELKSRLFNSINGEAVIHGLASDAEPVNEANEDAVIAAEGIRPEDGVDVSQMVGTGAVTVDLPYSPEQAAIVERLLTEGHTVVAADHTGAMIKHEPEFTLEVGEGGDVATNRVEIPVEGWNDGRVVEIEETDGTEEAEAPLTMADVKAVAAALATLPPRVKRTPEEIAQAREERRARIEAGAYKAPAVAATKTVKVPKSTLVYEAIKAEGGASFVDLIALTDWQKHTLRGYIAGTLRKRAAKEGLEIEAFKVKGEPTRYRALPTE